VRVPRHGRATNAAELRAHAARIGSSSLPRPRPPSPRSRADWGPRPCWAHPLCSMRGTGSQGPSPAPTVGARRRCDG
jgi:hypothetical protein